MTTNPQHAEAIDKLSFVHERLGTAHPNNGFWFTPKAEFGSSTIHRVEITADGTTLCVFTSDGGQLRYKVEFTFETPGNVINQAVAAAMTARNQSV